MEGGSYIPVIYSSGHKNACAVIPNAQEEKQHIEAVLQRVLSLKSGKLVFGTPGSAAECLAYNRGFCDGFAAAAPDTKIVNTPHAIDEETGERLSRRLGKRNKRTK